jgi:hypothetical protein
MTVVICRVCRHDRIRHESRGCDVHECRCLLTERRLQETNAVMIAQRRSARLR